MTIELDKDDRKLIIQLIAGTILIVLFVCYVLYEMTIGAQHRKKTVHDFINIDSKEIVSIRLLPCRHDCLTDNEVQIEDIVMIKHICEVLKDYKKVPGRKSRNIWCCNLAFKKKDGSVINITLLKNKNVYTGNGLEKNEIFCTYNFDRYGVSLGTYRNDGFGDLIEDIGKSGKTKYKNTKYLSFPFKEDRAYDPDFKKF